MLKIDLVPKTYYIYFIINYVNWKVYIGYTEDTYNRWIRGHRNNLGNKKHINRHLQAAWTLYGEENFEFIVLSETYKTKQEAIDEEIRLIAIYKEKGIAYNITDGGEGASGYTRSEETRQRSRLANLGRKQTPEHIENARITRIGKKKTPEQRLNMSKSHIGNHHTEETKKLLSEIVKARPPDSIETRKRKSESHKGLLIGENNGMYGKTPWNKGIGSTYKAFDEEKTLFDWSIDSRCVVSLAVLKGRVNRYNWDVEIAITKPLQKGKN
jgi:group I intron endonuclease